MIRVRQFREYLQLLRESSHPTDVEEDRALLRFLETLSKHDQMALSDFFRRFTVKANTPQTRNERAATTPSVDDLVSRLQSAFNDDRRFDEVLSQIEGQRGITKLALTQIFYRLFDRTRGVPKSATRTDLIRLIADERLVLVRNRKMGEMLGRRPVPAE